MTLIASRAALLHAAVQDLCAGKQDAAGRLPLLADKAAHPDLVVLLRREAARAQAQGRRLLAPGPQTNGPANLWMAGILDDAERDARQTEPGRLLDVALVGAVRKAKAAEIVSSDTAIALARATDEAAMEASVRRNREEEIETDRALKALLSVLTA